jgi:hypothetical protein
VSSFTDREYETPQHDRQDTLRRQKIARVTAEAGQNVADAPLGPGRAMLP